MRATLRGTFEAILASGGTVILAVLTLLLSELNSNRGLGPVAAMGIAFAMLAALTFLPAVLVLLGRQAFWPVRPTLDHTNPDPQVRGLWARVAALVDRKPVRCWRPRCRAGRLCAFVPAFKAQGVPQSDFFLTRWSRRRARKRWRGTSRPARAARRSSSDRPTTAEMTP